MFQGSLLVIVIMIDGSEKRNCEGGFWALEFTFLLKSAVSNDDGDASENGKRKAIGLDWQNNNPARASRFFCTFRCRHCTTTPWKCLFSRFVENVNTDSFFQKKKIANIW